MRRQIILGVTLLFIGVFAFLTIAAIEDGGFGPLEFVSVVVLGLFSFGIVGALRHPPEE